MEVRKKFDDRIRSKLFRSILNMPTLKQFESIFTTNSFVDDLIRSIRRGCSSIRKTIINVSNRKFPYVFKICYQFIEKTYFNLIIS